MNTIPNTKPAYREQNWLIRFNGIVMIAALVLLIYGLIQRWDLSDRTTVLYPLYRIPAQFDTVIALNCLAVICSVPVMTLTTFTTLILHIVREAPLKKDGIAIVFAVIAVISLYFGLMLTIFSPGLCHIDSARMGSTLYQLAYGCGFFDEGLPHYFLYECDNSELNCSLIYETKRQLLPYRERFGDLKVNIATHTLSVIIDGETIYTYTPE
jgi:hypothetical protein